MAEVAMVHAVLECSEVDECGTGRISKEENWPEKLICSSKTKPRLQAKSVVQCVQFRTDP